MSEQRCLNTEMRAAGPSVLYLDFDGVLHPDAVYRHPKRGIFLDAAQAPGRWLFEWADVLIEALEPYPQVRIVLSTSWVRVLGYSRARASLPQRLSERVVGATFHSRVHRFAERPFRLGIPARGVEVSRDAHRRAPLEWVAVDDAREGWAAWDLERIVFCDPSAGLGDPETARRLNQTLQRHFAGTKDDACT